MKCNEVGVTFYSYFQYRIFVHYYTMGLSMIINDLKYTSCVKYCLVFIHFYAIFSKNWGWYPR